MKIEWSTRDQHMNVRTRGRKSERILRSFTKYCNILWAI